MTVANDNAAKPELTAERLRELLTYDPETGLFVWRVNRRGNPRAGDVAGSYDGQGYLRKSIDDRDYRAHSLAWLHTKGEWPPIGIDHIDTIKWRCPWRSPKTLAVSGGVGRSFWRRVHLLRASPRRVSYRRAGHLVPQSSPASWLANRPCHSVPSVPLCH
jgi:hypothetical protein